MVTKSPTRKTSSSCEQSLFLFSFWSSKRKGSSALIASRLWSRRSPNVWASQSCFLLSNWFFECEHLFIGKPMVITKPAVPRARLLGLGSKLYPSNMQRILNKDLIRFKQSHSQKVTRRLCSAGRESKRVTFKVYMYFARLRIWPVDDTIGFL